jgi:multidrug efflux system membrane fusion protein
MSARGRTFAIAVVGLVAVSGLIYYLAPWQPAPEQNQRGRRFGAEMGPVPVLVAPARLADVPVYLVGVGSARALNTVTVRPQVEGKLISVSFTEGQDVEKGHVLARIDPTTYQAAYDQAVAKKAQDEAQLANARVDLERYARLAASNAINKQQLDTQRALVNQLEALVKLDQAAIDNVRAILSYTTITAPISGRTGIRMVDEGNIVRPTDPGIVVITQVKPIAVLFNLPQQELPEINKGMAEGPLPVAAIGADGKAVVDRGKVLVIDNQVDQATGTVRLKAEFPNAGLQLWPGQFVNVQLLIDTLRQVIVIPTAAVQRGPSGTFVYVVSEKNTAVVRQVTVRQQDDREAVIATGLKPDERVITTGFARLADGSLVRIATAETPTSETAPPKRRRGDGQGKGKRKRDATETQSQAPGGPPSATQ